MTHEVPPCRVDILTKDLGTMHPEQTGLPCAVQAVRVAVTADVESRSHVVVRVAQAPWTTPIDIDRVRALFPVDFVSCIRSDSPGYAEVSCMSGSEVEVLGAAAAVATLARAWGWDESPAIEVRFVGTSRSVTADPRFECGVWTVAMK